MASWSEFEDAEPEFASRVRALLTSRKHLTIATLRRDGSPRISGSEVELAEMRELVVDAWRMVVTDRVASAYDQGRRL